MLTKDVAWMFTDLLQDPYIFEKFMVVYEQRDSCKEYLFNGGYENCMTEKFNYCYETILPELNKLGTIEDRLKGVELLDYHIGW